MRLRLSVLTVLVALLAGSSHVAAAADVNTFVPVTGPTPDDCNSEVVEITGQLHVVMHMTGSLSGGFHFDSVDNFANVKGVGLTTGINYTVTDTTHTDFNIVDGLTFTTTITEAHQVNSVGPTPNFFLHDVLHVTFNENGPSAFVDNIRFGCTP